MIRGSFSFWQMAAIDSPTRKINARDVNTNVPPLNAKKLMLFCECRIAEVISLKSGLGHPRENFIPSDSITHLSLLVNRILKFKQLLTMPDLVTKWKILVNENYFFMPW